MASCATHGPVVPNALAPGTARREGPCRRYPAWALAWPPTRLHRGPVESEVSELLEPVGGELPAPALGVGKEHPKLHLCPVLQPLYMCSGDRYVAFLGLVLRRGRESLFEGRRRASSVLLGLLLAARTCRMVSAPPLSPAASVVPAVPASVNTDAASSSSTVAFSNSVAAAPSLGRVRRGRLPLGPAQPWTTRSAVMRGTRETARVFPSLGHGDALPEHGLPVAASVGTLAGLPHERGLPKAQLAAPTSAWRQPDRARDPARPVGHWCAASKDSSCQRQLAVPSLWMCSMNSATAVPSGKDMASVLRIWV